MTIDKRIKKEKARLLELFSALDTKKLKAVQGLIDNAAYLRVQLEEMRADIILNGVVELFSQSEKSEPYERERPISKLYCNYTQKYNDTIFKLCKYLTADNVQELEQDILGDFIKERNVI